MEKFHILKQKANKDYRMADHLLKVTYPLIKDTKLLLNITENIFSAFDNSMSAILHHERLFKLVPAFNDNFESRIQLFHRKCVPRFNIDKKYLSLVLDLKETLQLHKKSPVEFSKQDRFIICTGDYQTKAITANQLKDYLVKVYEFIDIMDQITSRNGVWDRIKA